MKRAENRRNQARELLSIADSPNENVQASHISQGSSLSSVELISLGHPQVNGGASAKAAVVPCATRRVWLSLLFLRFPKVSSRSGRPQKVCYKPSYISWSSNFLGKCHPSPPRLDPNRSEAFLDASSPDVRRINFCQAVFSSDLEASSGEPPSPLFPNNLSAADADFHAGVHKISLRGRFLNQPVPFQ